MASHFLSRFTFNQAFGLGHRPCCICRAKQLQYHKMIEFFGGVLAIPPSMILNGDFFRFCSPLSYSDLVRYRLFKLNF
ncbi:hypothetical protein MTR_3g071340 [Medicago truncatula]|uniref:Uncharacterized protein n=1 Tax=Medicago truncatula TaxID=3880 RepID=G7JBV9_MEDTR|nr:hypothetical protein MTR_3g071340 [Medicago truncatula]